MIGKTEKIRVLLIQTPNKPGSLMSFKTAWKNEK